MTATLLSSIEFTMYRSLFNRTISCGRQVRPASRLAPQFTRSRFYSTPSNAPNSDGPKSDGPNSDGPKSNGPISNKQGPKWQKQDQGTRFRYFFYLFIFSSGLLVAATRKVDNKKPQTSFTEKEYKEYEEATGLKRRSKLIHGELLEKYNFYVVPFVHQDESIDKIVSKLPKDKEVKVIDPKQLVEQEIDDPTAKYSILLQDLRALNKPLVKGLITALIKQEINLYMNTRKGTFDTNFVIKNYPQNADEAIRFENTISDITKCLVLRYDINNELSKSKTENEQRLIKNVIGYFDVVNKNRYIDLNHDEMDDKLQEIVLEDL